MRNQKKAIIVVSVLFFFAGVYAMLVCDSIYRHGFDPTDAINSIIIVFVCALSINSAFISLKNKPE